MPISQKPRKPYKPRAFEMQLAQRVAALIQIVAQQGAEIKAIGEAHNKLVRAIVKEAEKPDEIIVTDKLPPSLVVP